jgi:hypothetical protein
LFITGIQTLADYFNARKNMMDDTAATSVMHPCPQDVSANEVGDEPIIAVVP